MADDIFLNHLESALKQRGILVKQWLSPDNLLVEIDSSELRLNLANTRKHFAVAANPELFSAFADSVIESRKPLPATWIEAKARVRLALEPGDYQFGNVLHIHLSGLTTQVGVYARDGEKSLRWIDQRQLQEWGVAEVEFWQAAHATMAELLQQTPIEVNFVDGHLLAMFNTSSISKAALILSPNLKEVIAPKLGWPVYAVTPCRDFAYIFSDSALIERLGEIVIREYANSAYPISTEVLEISDDGIEAIGKFG